MQTKLKGFLEKIKGFFTKLNKKTRILLGACGVVLLLLLIATAVFPHLCLLLARAFGG